MSVSNDIKIVVFDLDETLGNFVEFSIFWDAIENIIGKTKMQNNFTKVLDLYPEFLRPNIFSLLNYLKHKKQKNECNKIMIYTNNQGPKSWSIHIKNYFEDHLNYKLFDQVIGAFKINGKQLELGRTSHDKTVDDLIRCTRIPNNTKICFLDDQYHPQMDDEQVYYIHVKPYEHHIPYKIMIDRFLMSEFAKNIKNHAEFKREMLSFMNQYDFIVEMKDPKEQEIDKIISKRIMLHLQKFLKKPRSVNRVKIRRPRDNKSRRNLNYKVKNSSRKRKIK